MKKSIVLASTLLFSLPSLSQVVSSEFTKPTTLSKARKVQSEPSLNDIKFSNASIPLKKFRETYSHLNDDAFGKKLTGALSQGPLMFFRSYVNTYYSDLSDSNRSENLILCLGDAHPENFGFIGFQNETRFVFNDLDDSGVCPYEYDVLRYFAATSLAFNDKALLKDLMREYAQVLEGKKGAESLSKDLLPNLEKKRAKILSKNTDGRNFLYSDELLALERTQKKDFLAQLQTIPLFSKLSILDIAQVPRDTGGSGGLSRYWLLVKTPQGMDILEMKEMGRPGTSYGSWNIPAWTQEQRLEKVKKYVWGQNPDFYNAITLQGTSFLIRSRTKDSVDIKNLSGKSLKNYLLVQVGLIANYHRAFVKGGIPNLTDWLEKNLTPLTERYSNTFKNLSQ